MRAAISHNYAVTVTGIGKFQKRLCT